MPGQPPKSPKWPFQNMARMLLRIALPVHCPRRKTEGGYEVIVLADQAAALDSSVRVLEAMEHPSVYAVDSLSSFPATDSSTAITLFSLSLFGVSCK